jgi:hypothetical protein
MLGRMPEHSRGMLGAVGTADTVLQPALLCFFVSFSLGVLVWGLDCRRAVL